MRYFLLKALCVAFFATCAPGIAVAQATGNFPSKAVTFIITAAAGGPNDIETRRYATKMTELLGHPFLLDFKPGAATTIGAAYVAKASPDGHTLLVVSPGFTIYSNFYPNLPFDVVRDFTAVSLMSRAPFVIIVHPSFPAKSFREYVAYARANPGKVNWGTAGAGAVMHLGPAWAHIAVDANVTFVHYKGTAPLILDIVAGHLTAGAPPAASAIPLVRAGKVRALAILGDKRSKLFPNVPTVAEQGVPDFKLSAWTGIVAPAGTPSSTVNKLSENLAKVAKMPDIVAALEAGGAEAVGSTPEEFKEVILTETVRWKKIIQEKGIKARQ